MVSAGPTENKRLRKRLTLKLVLIVAAACGVLSALIFGLYALYATAAAEGELVFFIKIDYFPDFHEKHGQWPTSLDGFVDYCKTKHFEGVGEQYLALHPKLVLIDNDANTFRANLVFPYGSAIIIKGDTTLDR